MCARRFLISIFILTLLFVAGAFAIFQFGDRVLIKSAVPTGHFEAAKAGAGPDYADAANWLSRPGIEGGSQWLPEGVQHDKAGNAAIFYVHPTTYLRRDRWNAPLEPSGDTEFRTRLFVQSQASAFNSDGDIWAPRYRQAAFGAFLLNSQDARKALDLAYSDVSTAFDRFLGEAANRPIILAAHSQGALLLSRLLKDQGAKLKGRVVAAYIVGWPISTKADLPALGLPYYPMLAGLNLSKGGKHEFDYALRMVAGFGGQGNYSLLKKITSGENRITNIERHSEWLKKISGYDNPELIKDGRLLVIAGTQTGSKNKRFDTVQKEEASENIKVQHAAKYPDKQNAQHSNIVDIILNIVSEITKYPKDMLELDMEMEADLGIDTVKQASIFAKMVDNLKIPEEYINSIEL
jgi:hypothetical protein